MPVPDNEGEILAVCKVEEKEDSSCEATAKDACTQTPQKRRRGGRGSWMRRLLAFLEVFQLMLREKKGLPQLSRLLSLKETDTRFSKRRELKGSQEESASQKLHGKMFKVEEKEDESGPRKEILSSGSTNSTLKNFPTGAKPPSTQPLPHGPCLPSSPAILHPMDSLSSVWSDACRQLGDLWRLPNVGNCCSFFTAQ